MQTHRLRLWPEVSQRQYWIPLLFAACGGLLMTIFFLFWSVWLPQGQVAPGVHVAGISLDGQTYAQATEQLQAQLRPLEDRPIQVEFESMTWQTSTALLGETPQYDEMLQQAWSVGRTGNWWQQIRARWISRWYGTEIEASWQFDPSKVTLWTDALNLQISKPGVAPSAQVTGNQVTILEGERGLQLNTSELQTQLQALAGQPQTDPVPAPVDVTITPLTPDGVQAAEARAEKLMSVRLKIMADESERPIEISPNEFFTWLTWPEGYNEATLSARVAELTQSWVREPADAQFKPSANPKKLEVFVPHRMGRRLQTEELRQEIMEALNTAQNAEELPPQPFVLTAQFEEQAPQVTLQELNTQGVVERIAVGTSNYKGSIPNRIFNVGLTAERLHGTIIAPGEELSFNESVGEVSGKTGYKSAYVIMGGRTQLGDGGGVCQVSTTLFRAALNGGLPISRWKAHSYRVGYYEQGTEPGFDATVYSPSVDFRFRNDTEHSIAVAAYPDSANQFLTIELWGTSDGRTSSISNYKIWNQRSAPAPLFVDDPNLPAGKRQQIDWAASGANTSFHYVAKSKDGEIIQDREFVSIFRPWQAVYLVGTGGQ